MAIESGGGWIWTAEEKQWARSWQRALYEQFKEVAEQVTRFRDALPALADEAAGAAKPFMDACDPLLAIDTRPHGRKAQPISPEQASESLEAANRGLRKWGEFVNRDDVVNAIREANKAIRLAKRRIRQTRMETLEKLDGPERAEFLARHVENIKGMARFYAQGVQFALRYGEAADLPALERLYLVCFVLSVAESSSKMTNALKQFITNSKTAPDLDAAVGEAARILLKDLLKRWPNVVDEYKDPINKFASLAHQRLYVTVLGLVEQGIPPTSIPKSCYSIFKRDFSPAGAAGKENQSADPLPEEPRA